MAKASPIIGNLNAGEFSPMLDGRVDYAKYPNAAARLENFIPTVQGPHVRRGGTRLVSEVKSSAAGRYLLVPFEYSVGQAYMLEFGDYSVRFFTWDPVTLERGLLQPSSTAWAAFQPYAAGELVTYLGVLYYCKVTHFANAAFAPANFAAITGPAYEVPTPYAIADLFNADGTPRLRFAQSGDFLYLAHQSYQPRILKRITPTRFVLDAFSPAGGPWKALNDTATTVYASAETGTGITLTASAPIFEAGHVGALFQLENKDVNAIAAWEPGKAVTVGVRRRSDGKTYECLTAGTTGANRPVHNEGALFDGDPGAQWQYRDPGYGYVRITAVASGTSATADVVDRLPSQVVGSGNATTRWSFGAWSSVEGWPSQVTFFRERMWWLRGQEGWASVSADFSDYAPRIYGTVTADAGFSFQINSGKVNDVQWVMPSDRDLLLGTAGGEFAVGELTNGEPLGPNNRRVRLVSEFGTRAIPPVKNGKSTLFVQRSGLVARETFYDFGSDGYDSTETTIEADHITRTGLQQIAFAAEPTPVVWAIRADGLLVGFTWNNEQKVRGWHRHPIGGAGVVESIAVLQAAEGDRQELWMVVRRTINGVTRRYVEYLERPWREGDSQASQFYVDSGLTYDGAAATTITGLSHLEGQVVDVLADGAPHPQRTVTGGQITLQRAASVVQVGLPCPCLYKSMRIEAGAADGTAQGKTKRIHKAVLRFLDTGGGSYGGNEAQLDDLMLRTSADPMGQPVPLFSGDKVVPWPEGYTTDCRMVFKNAQPTAVTLVALMPQVVTSDAR
jgi:hypothetical protein